MREFPRKIHNLTGMTQYQFSNAKLSRYGDTKATRAIEAIEQRVASTAEEIGWKAVMEQATEITHQVNHPNCEYILGAIESGGDTSLAADFAKLFAASDVSPPDSMAPRMYITSSRFC